MRSSARERYSPFLREALQALPGHRRDASSRRARSRGRARAWRCNRRRRSTSSFAGSGHGLALAVALGDLAGELSLEQVTRAAVRFRRSRRSTRRSQPRSRSACPDAEPTGFAVIAMGKLGSRELNYSSDVDLLLLFDPGTPAAARARRCRRGRGAHRPAADRAAAEADRRRLCRSASTCGFGRRPKSRRSPCRSTPRSRITNRSRCRGSARPSSAPAPAPATSRSASASSTRSSRSSGAARSTSA